VSAINVAGRQRTTAPTVGAWECDRAFRRGEEHQGDGQGRTRLRA